MKNKKRSARSITSRVKKYLNTLGPGLITGASDDDPSGIATYSQAGAGFGLSTLWTALFTFPLMAAIQGMCARIGLVTKKGLTGTLKKHYPKTILYLMLVFSFPAITLNIGSDIQSMGAVTHLLIPQVPVFAFSLLFTTILLFFIIKYSYRKIASVLKWLCITLFLYIAVPFWVTENWSEVFRNTFLPSVHFNREFLAILVAVFGTTISPYLFFWQATMEAENVTQNSIIVDKKILNEMKNDVNTGMFFSNLVMFFIILTTSAVLFKAGIRRIDSVEEAAEALKPLAGNLAYLFFALGIIGTGFLAIPVLAGSLSYILAETFDWQEGLDKKFYQAKGFYITIIISMVVGLLLNSIGITPFQSLIYTAILYGLTAPVMVAIVLHIGNNKKVMKEFTNTTLSNVLGFITLVIMSFSAVALLYLQFVK